MRTHLTKTINITPYLRSVLADIFHQFLLQDGQCFCRDGVQLRGRRLDQVSSRLHGFEQAYTKKRVIFSEKEKTVPNLAAMSEPKTNYKRVVAFLSEMGKK